MTSVMMPRALSTAPALLFHLVNLPSSSGSTSTLINHKCTIPNQQKVRREDITGVVRRRLFVFAPTPRASRRALAAASR